MLPKQLRSPGQYAGVKNGGATCYMNSVFQQLFMQPGIRARVLGSGEVRRVLLVSAGCKVWFVDINSQSGSACTGASW
jgi:hypothetical protein